ncbi:hypothetical protein KA005_61745, partial [bacterium]|nr:hypothetical protein [bacterium]
MLNLNNIDFSGIPKKVDAPLGDIDFTGIPKAGEAERPPELHIKEEFAPREIPKWSVVKMPQGVEEQPIKESLLISGMFDVPPNLVMENLESFKLKNPDIKGWGEADNIGWSKSLEKAISMLKPVPALAAGGVIEAGAGALALGGFDKKAKEWRDDVKLVREQIQLEDPVERGSWSEATRNAFTSIYTQAPAYGVGLLLRSGGAALSILGAQTGLQKTSELIEAGEEKGLAAGMGFISGSSEALTEMIPFGAFADILKKSPGVGKSMVKLFLGEQVGEQMNTAVDFAIDSVTVNPDMAWEDYLQRVKTTAKATLVQTGKMGAGAGTYRLAVERGETKELVKEMPEELKAIFDEAKNDATGKGMEDVKAT